MRPLIAVPAYDLMPGRVRHWRESGVAVPAPYVEALHRAGAQEAILMPVPVSDADAAELLARFDGLVLLGGGDLDPACYGQAPGAELYGVSEARDAFELALTRAAIEQEIPTLAICRGVQALNVVLGGDLDQHITGRPGLMVHGTPNEEDGAVIHDVALERGSRLAAAIRVARPACSSHHHQAIDRLGDDLVVTARSDDGIVEGVELARAAWVVGVQWHPEDTAASDPVQQRLFDAFVEQAGHLSSRKA